MSRQKKRFDLVDMINRVTPTNIEFHLNCKDPVSGAVSKCSFLGPNTNLPKRLANYSPSDGSFTSVITPAVNNLDSLAMVHDIAYTSKNLEVRHEADRELMIGAQKLIDDPNTDRHTKRNATVVKTIMKIKIKLGFGYNVRVGGAIDIGALTRSAQEASKSSSFSGGPAAGIAGIGIPLLVLASAIGIPAVLSLLKKRKKDKKK